MAGRPLRAPQRAGAVVTLILFAALSTPAAAKTVKPDLVLGDKPKVSPVGPSEGDPIDLLDSEVKNEKKGKGKGKAPDTLSAGPSTTVLQLTHAPQVRRRVAVTKEVPKLGPGESQAGTGRAILRGFPPGEYTGRVCADHGNKVKERNEANNCAEIGKVYVIIRSFGGSFSGSTHLEEGLTEEWSSSGAELIELETQEDGRFVYVFTGHVQYSISGTDIDGCAYSGGGITPISAVGEDGLTLDYRKGQYWGNQGLGGERPFTWNVKCQNEAPQDLEGPFDFAGGFVVVDPIAAKAMPFGTTRLNDTASEAEGGDTHTWTWDLNASTPPQRSP